jgi:hypothetical protein
MSATFVDFPFPNRPTTDVVAFSNRLQISNYSLDKNLRTQIRVNITGYISWATGKKGRYGNDFRPNIFVQLLERGNLVHDYGNITVNYGYPNNTSSQVKSLAPYNYDIPPGNTKILQLKMIYQLTRGDQWGYIQVNLSFSSFSAVLLGL